jgi:hypothetical protein
MFAKPVSKPEGLKGNRATRVALLIGGLDMTLAIARVYSTTFSNAFIFSRHSCGMLIVFSSL